MNRAAGRARPPDPNCALSGDAGGAEYTRLPGAAIVRTVTATFSPPRIIRENLRGEIGAGPRRIVANDRDSGRSLAILALRELPDLRVIFLIGPSSICQQAEGLQRQLIPRGETCTVILRP